MGEVWAKQMRPEIETSKASTPDADPVAGISGEFKFFFICDPHFLN